MFRDRRLPPIHSVAPSNLHDRKPLPGAGFGLSPGEMMKKQQREARLIAMVIGFGSVGCCAATMALIDMANKHPEIVEKVVQGLMW